MTDLNWASSLNCSNLSHLSKFPPKRIFQSKGFLIHTTKTQLFHRKKTLSGLVIKKFHILTRNNDSSQQSKNFFILSRKKIHTIVSKNQIFQTKIISCNYWKKNKYFLYPVLIIVRRFSKFFFNQLSFSIFWQILISFATILSRFSFPYVGRLFSTDSFCSYSLLS